MDEAIEAFRWERCAFECCARLRNQEETGSELTRARHRTALRALNWGGEDTLSARSIGRAETEMPEMVDPKKMQQALRKTAETATTLPLAMLSDGQLLCTHERKIKLVLRKRRQIFMELLLILLLLMIWILCMTEVIDNTI